MLSLYCSHWEDELESYRNKLRKFRIALILEGALV